ncbi:UNVERIFIED_CONTAM: hypothetical protein HDU68_012718 [Siphonaria sp. JEL0065]|nr:hypothetical protein HDU68_012718 [Siphonaria sp. JEL0065]
MKAALASILFVAATVLAADVPVGGACGGGTANAPKCESNLDCVYPALETPLAGAQGVCKLKISDVDGPCKQVFPNSAICKEGLVCVEPAQVNPPVAGASGTCKLPTSSTSTTGSTASASYTPSAVPTTTATATKNLVGGATGIAGSAVMAVAAAVAFFF